MRLFIKQKVFSWNDRFTVKNEAGEDIFFVEGEFLTFGKKLRVYDKNHHEIVYIEQKIWRLLPEYELYQQNTKVATIKKELTFFKNNYQITEKNWFIEGSITAHDYVIKDQSGVIADINKEWLSWGDTYDIRVHEEESLPVLLGIVIVIDCVISSTRNNSS